MSEKIDIEKEKEMKRDRDRDDTSHPIVSSPQAGRVMMVSKGLQGYEGKY